MPTYNYRCNQCEIEFSIFQGINDIKVNNCPKCDSSESTERMITGGTGMIFKGDGFYITDYVKNKDNKEKKLKDNKEKKLKDNKGNKNEQS